MNSLDYVPGSVPEGCRYKISPSSFGYFITKVHMWYRQQILGLDKFEYSTSSVLGTVIHYVAECVAKGIDVDEKAIEEYIEKHEENEDYCSETVRLNWYEMAEVLVNNYTLHPDTHILEAEKQVCVEIYDQIFASGTLDLLEGTKEDCILTDYKSYNSKTKPRAFTPEYKYQLLVYAWLLRKLGYNVNRIRLVYINRRIDGGLSEKTGKPLKSYPPEVTVLTEQVTEEDLQFIESQLMLCADTLNAVEKYPELTHVIIKDPRLKV